MASPAASHGIEALMLTDAKLKAAKARESAYKLADSEQLYVLVSPAGGRHFRVNYTFGRNAAGRPVQKTLSLGSYPLMTLFEARKRRDEAKAVLREGRDPAVARRNAVRAKVSADLNTFEKIARRWHALQMSRWSKVHAADVLGSLEDNAFPRIGEMPLAEIDAPLLLELLEAVQDRGAIETAHRIRSRISSVFVYAVAAGLAKTDPAASLGKALKPKPRSKPQPSIVDGRRTLADKVIATRQLLIDCEAERCRAVTKLALRFAALTAVRPNELQHATWVEFEGLDGPEPTWIIPAARMKGDEERKAEEFGDHIVPLAPAAVEVLAALRPLSGHLPILFPGERHAHRPISENTLRALLIRAGYYQRHVPHGFRAAFSTIMNERLKAAGRGDDRAVVDLMLAHVPKGTSGSEGAYNRAGYMPRRREIAGEWAELLVGDMWSPDVHLGRPMRWASHGAGKPR